MASGELSNGEFSSNIGGHDPWLLSSLTIEVFMIFGRVAGAKEAVFTTDTDVNQAVLLEMQFNEFHTHTLYIHSFGITLPTAGSTTGKSTGYVVYASWSFCSFYV